jgi:serine/threonine-protein kinase
VAALDATLRIALSSARMPLSNQKDQRADARIGLWLNDKWHLRCVLGQGGMATVYGAVHRNKKRAAIKMLHPELSVVANIRDRFLREGYVANSIDHPAVVLIDDDDIAADGSAYLVMELLQGETIEDRVIRLGGVLPLEEVLALTEEVLDVLAVAHDAGIVHRDIKPENLFLTTSGQLKILDFGIARARELATSGHTTMGSFMGTPSFMAPEQARGRWNEVDGRSDVWSVGATMYLLLTGRPVHEAETINEQLIMAATAEAPSLEKYRPDLPIEIVELIGRALMRNPAERWRSARAMQEALRACARAFPLHEPMRAPSERAMRWPEILALPERELSSARISPHDPTLAAAGVDSDPGATSPVDATLVSSSVTTAQRRRRASRWLVAVGAILFLGATVFAALRVSSVQTGSSATQASVPVPEPHYENPPILAEGDKTEESAAEAVNEPVTESSAEPSPSPSASMALPPPSATRQSSPRGTKPRPKPVPKARPSASPAGTSNPFDRRF